MHAPNIVITKFLSVGIVEYSALHRIISLLSSDNLTTARSGEPKYSPKQKWFHLLSNFSQSHQLILLKVSFYHITPSCQNETACQRPGSLSEHRLQRPGSPQSLITMAESPGEEPRVSSSASHRSQGGTFFSQLLSAWSMGHIFLNSFLRSTFKKTDQLSYTP